MSEPRQTLDLNCDLGESFGVYTYGADSQMMPLITSANIACGAHAGDPATMRTSVELALSHGVHIGAHVGLPDRAGFGRREIPVTPQEVHDLCLSQTGALAAFVTARGDRLQHLKLHGALYMMCNRDPDLAAAVSEAVVALDPGMLVYALPGSALAGAASAAGLTVVDEVFGDRPYAGREVQMYRRSEEDIGTSDDVVRRVLHLLDGPDGASVGTVCVHSDTPNGPAHLAAVRDALLARGHALGSPGRAA